MDSGDYDPTDKPFVRDSIRAIVIREGKICLVHSRLYDYYKFPGGGIEAGESHTATLLREAREEAGLRVNPDSLTPYGHVPRRERYEKGEYAWFSQDNLYYLCTAEPGEAQHLDAYEAKEGFTPVWIDPQTAIQANRTPNHGPKSPTMIEREARVLELLIEEGYFESPGTNLPEEQV